MSTPRQVSARITKLMGRRPEFYDSIKNGTRHKWYISEHDYNNLSASLKKDSRVKFFKGLISSYGVRRPKIYVDIPKGE